LQVLFRVARATLRTLAGDHISSADVELRLADEGGVASDAAVEHDEPSDSRPEGEELLPKERSPRTAGASAADCAVTCSNEQMLSCSSPLKPAMAPARAAKMLHGLDARFKAAECKNEPLEPKQGESKSDCITCPLARPRQQCRALQQQEPQLNLLTSNRIQHPLLQHE